MRTLVLLRGSSGCGKSTFIKEHKLDDYTLSSDSFRLLYSSPILMNDGTQSISGKHEKKTWETLFNILEYRMEQGLFTVIDATNSRISEINKYKKLAEFYRYNVIVVDFTDLPRDECKIRNANRQPSYKIVPNSVIDKFYDRFDKKEKLSGVKVVKPHEFEEAIMIKPIDVSYYNDIQIIGDIHGCYDALIEILEDGELKEDRLYIFTGDFCDRGIQNAEVLEYLFNIMDNDNVILLEGNHEKALWRYANDLPIKRRYFEKYTKEELINKNVSKSKIRHLYKRLRQIALLKFDEKTLFICHGGITNLPKDIHLISAEQLIYGVGNYEDVEMVDGVFELNTSSTTYQIHGHRNVNSKPINITPRCFCLEDKVELGGHLRSVIFTHSIIKTISVKNNIYKDTDEIKSNVRMD